MTQPKIDLLGVYRLQVSEDLFREQFDILYGFPMDDAERIAAERQCREQLESIVLIEVIVSNRDKRFRVSGFGQGEQAPWAEGYFSADGETRIPVRWPDVPDVEPLRMAFFIHFWDPAVPLKTSYGNLACAEPGPMSERLARLIPFEPVD
ncbi:MAG: hypothetical protein SH868_00250 [Bythopirellula sp.]|nr:hypothetical protein [Bythopirellula sp.]